MKKIKMFIKSGAEKELWEILANIENPKEINKFMNDILSPSEKSMIIQRWMIAKFFNKGWTYDKILLKIGASKTTSNRVYNILHRGTGGYELALNIFQKNNKFKKSVTSKSNLERYIDNRLKKGK